MADDVSNKLVLRTVYLPRDLDQELKVAAFRGERSKNDLIRELIQAGLKAKQSEGDRRFIATPAKAPVSVEPVAPKRKVVAVGGVPRSAGGRQQTRPRAARAGA